MAVLKLESGFLTSRAAKVLTAVLIVQASLLYGFKRTEITPVHKPLTELAHSLGNWQQIRDTGDRKRSPGRPEGR